MTKAAFEKVARAISPENARSVFAYDPETGHITYRVSAGGMRAGLRAGFKRTDGYRYVRCRGRIYLEHRLAWALHCGEWPAECIDHINMRRDDNRLSNLREATVTQNNRNRLAQSNNTSGYRGVTFHKGEGKFHAKICVNKRRISLGYFKTPQEAAAAYEEAASRNFGDFARMAL